MLCFTMIEIAARLKLFIAKLALNFPLTIGGTGAVGKVVIVTGGHFYYTLGKHFNLRQFGRGSREFGRRSREFGRRRHQAS